jgi:hypothetical protein
MVQTQFNKRIKVLRMDNEIEYINQKNLNFLNKKKHYSSNYLHLYTTTKW